jgi:hypothetical protein
MALIRAPAIADVNGVGHDASHWLTFGVINKDVAKASEAVTHRSASLFVSCSSKGSDVIQCLGNKFDVARSDA